MFCCLAINRLIYIKLLFTLGNTTNMDSQCCYIRHFKHETIELKIRISNENKTILYQTFVALDNYLHLSKQYVFEIQGRTSISNCESLHRISQYDFNIFGNTLVFWSEL